MILYLQLFWEFLKVGLFTFGGGYGSIPIIRDAVLSNPWMGISEDMFSYILGVAESTPGPIMINSATYIGSHCGGFFGAFFATLGVVIPSFVIILILACFLKNFLEKRGTRSVLDAIRPTVIGIILATGFCLIVKVLLPSLDTLLATSLSELRWPEWRVVLLFLLVLLSRVGYRLWKKKTISPILSIGISALLGIAVFGV